MPVGFRGTRPGASRVRAGDGGVSCRNGSVRPERASVDEGTDRSRVIPLVLGLLPWQAMAPVPRQQTSVVWLLDWLRAHPAIKAAVLKNEADDGRLVEVLVVPSKALGNLFAEKAKKKLLGQQEGLEDRRRRLLLHLLEQELYSSPSISDLELYGTESTLESISDFSAPEDVFEVPAAFFVTFEMNKKPGKTKTVNGGRRSNSGGPSYVIERPDSLEPGRPTWMANPAYPAVARLMRDLKKLLRPERPTLKIIASKLTAKKHKTLMGRGFTEQNVDRAIVAAELLLGNRDPSFKN